MLSLFKTIKCLILLGLIPSFQCELIEDVNKPVVLWHGMGDTCCFPFSLGSIKKLIQQQLNNTYVKSLEIGQNIVKDYESGFFIHPNDQVCHQ